MRCTDLYGILPPIDSFPQVIDSIHSYSLPESLAGYVAQLSVISSQGAQSLQVVASQLFFNARLVMGHFRFGLHSLSKARFAYATVMRHPIRRVISQFNFWSRCVPVTCSQIRIVRLRVDARGQAANHECCDPRYGYAQMRNQSLAQWVNSQGDAAFGEYMKSNHVTRVLCGLGSAVRGSFFWETAHQHDLEPVQEESFHCAMRNLKRHFRVVLVAEELHQIDVGALRALLGLAPDTQQKPMAWYLREGRRHATGASSPNQMLGNVDSAVKVAITEANRYDLLLYEAAVEMHRQLKNVTDGLKRHIKAVPSDITWRNGLPVQKKTRMLRKKTEVCNGLPVSGARGP